MVEKNGDDIQAAHPVRSMQGAEGKASGSHEVQQDPAATPQEDEQGAGAEFFYEQFMKMLEELGEPEGDAHLQIDWVDEARGDSKCQSSKQ